MIVLSRFEVPDAAAAAFEADARQALAALGARPGFVRGRLGRATDAPATWALVTEWDTVGSYRRGLSAYEVKLATAPLMAFSVPEASAFELVEVLDVVQPAGEPPSRRAR